MGRRGYSPEFRRLVLGLVKSGRKVSDVAKEFAISDQAVYSWLRQERVVNLLAVSPTGAEREELIAAKERIAQLEAELEVYRCAVGLRSGAMRPKAARTSPLSVVWKAPKDGSTDRSARRSLAGGER